MKQTICSVLGVIGSAIASFFGGWDAAVSYTHLRAHET